MDRQKFVHFVRNINIEKSINHFLNFGFISDDDHSIVALKDRIRGVFSGKEVPNKSEILNYLSLFSFDLSINEVNLILNYLYDGKIFLSRCNPIDILYYQHYQQHFTGHIEFLEIMAYITYLFMDNDINSAWSDEYICYIKKLLVGTNIDISTWEKEFDLFMRKLKGSLGDILLSVQIYLKDYSLRDNSIDQYIQKEFDLKGLSISLRQMSMPRSFIIIFLAFQEKLKSNQVIDLLPDNALHKFFEESIDNALERHILVRIFTQPSS